jgi:hypothetical protein
MSQSPLYDRDFRDWADEQAALLRVTARNIPITQRLDAQMHGYRRHGSLLRDSWRQSRPLREPKGIFGATQ